MAKRNLIYVLIVVTQTFLSTWGSFLHSCYIRSRMSQSFGGVLEEHHKMGLNAVIQGYLMKTECFSFTCVENLPSIHSSFIKAENVKLPPCFMLCHINTLLHFCGGCVS